MIEDFEQICGQAPEGTESLNFQASDPNFVFENDHNIEQEQIHLQQLGDKNIILLFGSKYFFQKAKLKKLKLIKKDELLVSLMIS